MTWRAFATRLAGLSPSSLWVLWRRASRKSEPTRRITDPAEAEAYFAGIA